VTNINTIANRKSTTISGKSPYLKPMTCKRNCPSFLSKTYTLISTCNPAIACWSEDGKSFVIKDQDALSSKVFLQYFKHNNLQSFIRQLNFYGFRKVRTDSDKTKSLLIKNYTILCYHHKMFVRGHPELLCKVRRSREKITNSAQEVISIRQDVNIIKENISTLTKEMGGLKDLLKILARKVVGETDCSTRKNVRPRKKFKMDHSPFFSKSEKVNQLSCVSSCEGQTRNIGKNSVNCLGLSQCRVQEIWHENLAKSLNSFSLLKSKYLNGTRHCDTATAHANMSSSSVDVCNNVEDKFDAIDSKQNNNLSQLTLVSNTPENFNDKFQPSLVNLSNVVLKKMDEQLITNELRKKHLERVHSLQVETNKIPKLVRRRSSTASAA